ncbi:hypothetical protein B7494_g8565 [Chlorociboria aeruginascens]|nr:hypothetical protein B7494_g8565 [Chlorociboria aeruginascens]
MLEDGPRRDIRPNRTDYIPNKTIINISLAMATGVASLESEKTYRTEIPIATNADGFDGNVGGEKSTGIVAESISEDNASPGETSTIETVREHNDDENHLRGFQLVILTMTLMLGQFLTALDATILTTAIPTITARFHSTADVGWYGSAYLFTTMAIQPTFGKIYMYFDIKWTFVCGLLIFELGSIICAAAVSSSMFIVGRAIAGVGQAAIVAGGMTVIGYRVPLQKRAIYFAILTSMSGLASVVGPVLGGVFTDSQRLTWRFSFWINVPLGSIALITGIISFKSPKRAALSLSLKQKLAKMDIIAWEIRLGDAATIPPRIISNRTVLSCCIYTFLISTGFSTLTYYLPFYFQVAKGVSAESSGLRLIAFLASVTVLELSTGASLLLVGYSVPFMWLGAILFCTGSGLLTTLQVGSPSQEWIGYQVLTGAGFGSSLQMAAVGMQSALEVDDLPTGNSVLLFSNFLGGSIGVSIAQSIFVNSLKRQLSQNIPQVNSSYIINAGATALHEVVPSDIFPAVVKAYAYAVTRSFFLPTAASAVALFVTFGIKWHNFKLGRIVT